MNSKMKKTFVSSLVGLVLLLAASGADAILVFYPDRPTFNAANPGLPVEDFNEGVGIAAGFPAPLDSTSSNAHFVPGDILPGVSFTDNPGPDVVDGLYFAPAFHNGLAQTTQGIGQEFPSSDALDILTSPGVTALAVDIFQNFGGGFQSGSPIDVPVNVFGPGDVLLGFTSVTVNSNSFGFFGVSSTLDLITRISINNTLSFDSIDNVAFGVAAAVPEPSTLLFLGSGLVVLAIVRRRIG